jgi:hypothetical protein
MDSLSAYLNLNPVQILQASILSAFALRIRHLPVLTTILTWLRTKFAQQKQVK